jgi:hypothetical protein
MENNSLARSALLMFVLVLAFIAGWEIYLRSKQSLIAYDDEGPLWADKRKKVYLPSDQATVFIGSSRNKFDLDTKTWRKLTGETPVQLAIEGNSPMPIFENLANDENFKGKLMVDVTEGLFFSDDPNNLGKPKKMIDYFKKETPAQKFSFQVNHLLESKLMFLDKDAFSLNRILLDANIPDRKGFLTMCIFPPDFQRVNFDRQVIMTKRFEQDTTLQNKVKSIWGFYASLHKGPPPPVSKYDSILNVVKTYTDKIIARGGKVLFVRTPSSGPYFEAEKTHFPREQFWNRILQVTGCQGIHFKDYPATDHFQCPEFSHLKQGDAVIWTTNLVDILQKDKGWQFPNAAANN